MKTRVHRILECLAEHPAGLTTRQLTTAVDGQAPKGLINWLFTGAAS
jgi:hypothetical protein